MRHQLHLGSLATIDEEKAILNRNELAGREPAEGRQSTAGSENCDFEHSVGAWYRIRVYDGCFPTKEVFGARVLLAILHVLLNFVHEHRIDGFFDGGQNIQDAIELGNFDEL